MSTDNDQIGVFVVCNGRMMNTPGKVAARCQKCGSIDYEKYEGDRCGREQRKRECGMHNESAVCGWCHPSKGGAQ